jgi:ATP-dependent Clp protease protease subunit
MNMKNISDDFRLFAMSNTNASASAVDKMIQSHNQLLAAYGGVNPTIIEERKLNVATMDVFSRLMMDRIIFLGTDIDDYTSNVIQAQMLYLSSKDNADISLYINSPGGVVYDGLGIYDTMQFIDCDVQTICTGMAASMASILLCAGTKGKRYALPHSRIMIHQPMGGVHGQASDIEIEAKQILKLKDELYQILADHSHKTLDQIEKDADRDHWMTAREAVEYGMIDSVLIKKAKSKENNQH